MKTWVSNNDLNKCTISKLFKLLNVGGLRKGNFPVGKDHDHNIHDLSEGHDRGWDQKSE
jgi:hypothetical protein